MRNKLIYSNFNKDTGESIVTIKNKYGTFTGKAKLNPRDDPSSYHGCRIAEKRAIVKCLKYRKQKAKEKYDTCNKFYNTITKIKDFDDTSLVAIEMQRYLFNLKYTYASLLKQIQTEEDLIKEDIKERDKILGHFKKYKHKRK